MSEFSRPFIDNLGDDEPALQSAIEANGQLPLGKIVYYIDTTAMSDNAISDGTTAE